MKLLTPFTTLSLAALLGLGIFAAPVADAAPTSKKAKSAQKKKAAKKKKAGKKAAKKAKAGKGIKPMVITPAQKEAAQKELAEQGITEEMYTKKLNDAIEEKNFERLQLLIQAGGDINKAEILPFAIWHWRDLKVIKLLLSVPGVDVNLNAGREYINTPLNTAAWTGNVEIVKLLLAMPGIDVNSLNGMKERTALETACWTERNLTPPGRREIAKILMQAPGIQLKGMETAIFSDDKELIEAFLAHPDYEPDSASVIEACIHNGKKEFAELITKHPRFKASEVDSSMLGIATGDIETYRKLVNQNGPNSKIQIRGQEQPLICLAAYMGHPDCLKELLKTNGIDINVENHERNTPLLLAIEQGNLECIKLLAQAPGIDLNRASRFTPPLCAAAENKKRSLDVLQYVLSLPGIDVNQPGHLGSPLHLAVYREMPIEFIKALLAAPGIDINAENSDHKTPLQLAEREGIKELLRAAGAK